MKKVICQLRLHNSFHDFRCAGKDADRPVVLPFQRIIFLEDGSNFSKLSSLWKLACINTFVVYKDGRIGAL